MSEKIKNVELTEEYRKIISELSAIRVNSEFNYIPKKYKLLPENLRPVFKLKSINGEELAELEDNIGYHTGNASNGEFKYHTNSGSYRLKLLSHGVVGWSNYYDIDGNIVEYSKENIKSLPIAMQKELENVISMSQKLTIEELRGLE